MSDTPKTRPEKKRRRAKESPEASNQEQPDAGAADVAGAVAESPTAADLDRVLDVMVELSVEIGRRRISISDVLNMHSGSVVEFSKTADQPLDIRVNEQLVARGEAVVMGERYGVRITEVVSPNDRLKRSGVIKEVSA